MRRSQALCRVAKRERGGKRKRGGSPHTHTLVRSPAAAETATSRVRTVSCRECSRQKGAWVTRLDSGSRPAPLRARGSGRGGGLRHPLGPAVAVQQRRVLGVLCMHIRELGQARGLLQAGGVRGEGREGMKGARGVRAGRASQTSQAGPIDYALEESVWPRGSHRVGQMGKGVDRQAVAEECSHLPCPGEPVPFP